MPAVAQQNKIQFTRVAKQKNLDAEAERISAQIFTSELGLTEFDRILVRERFANPRVTFSELAEKYGISRQAVDKHFKKEKVKIALARIHADIFAQIRIAQFAAMQTLQDIVTSPADTDAEKDIKFKAAKELLHVPLTAPQAMPEGKRELPEFGD